MKRSALYIFLPISLFMLVFFFGQKVIAFPEALAFTMSNTNYILEMGNLNSISGEAQGGGKKLGFTSGETGQGLVTGTNNKVKLGFQYIHPLRGFSFTLSQPLIDFGVLSATNPVVRNTLLTVNNNSSRGYSVTASEDHPLQTATSGQVIPDTTCDNGSCTELSAGSWASTLTYGFGYRCDPVSVRECADGFSSGESYKQFADSSKNEPPQAVMAGITTGAGKQVKITYKVNIPGTQPPGSYANSLTFIAVPSF